MVTGFDLFFAGSRLSRFGQIIGVPVNYEYESVDEVPISQIQVAGEVPTWNQETRDKFKSSLVLTEDEQIFGMMREILMSRTYQLALDCVYPVVATVGAYAMGHIINNKLQLFSRPRSLRQMLYFLVGVFMYGNYCFLTDMTTCYYETRVDLKIAELGDKWIKAGVGFYSKVLDKNITTRTLTGDNSKYTASGNINFFVRQRAMPLTNRKSFFEKKLEELASAAAANTS